MKKKILLIGGAGFIGHNLALYLQKKKYKIYIFDNLEVNNLKYVKKNIEDKKKKNCIQNLFMRDYLFLKKKKFH